MNPTVRAFRSCRKWLLASVMALLSMHAHAQVRVTETADELAFWLPGKATAAISFPLQEDWILARHGSNVVKDRFGSYRWKELLTYRPFKCEHIDSMRTDLDSTIHVFGTLRERSLWGKFELRAKAIDNEHLHLEVLADRAAPFARLILRYRQSSAEHIFGLGEQFSYLNMQGRKVPLIPEENGIGRGDRKITPFTRLAGISGNAFSSYCPIPFYMCTDGRGVLVTEGSPWYLDFSGQDVVEVFGLENHLTLEIWQKDSPLDILESYTLVNGRFRILPDWAWGTWLGVQGGGPKVSAVLQKMLAAGCPISAVWIQDWVGRRDTKFGQRLQWHWEPDSLRYPNLRNWIAEMRQQDIRVLGYINPFLKVESPWVDALTRQRSLIEDAHGQRLVMNAGGFDTYGFELHDPMTRAYLARLIRRNMIDLGFSGWMADFGEWYPGRGSVHTRRELPEWGTILLHNSNPVLWQQVNRMALDSAAAPYDLLFFSRSGYVGAGTYASAYWAGDQMTSYGAHDGLASAVKALISSGMSGIAINHSDIGGYTNVSNALLHMNRDAELLQRWAEFAAFTPIYRTHEGLKPAENVQPWDDTPAQAAFIQMAKVHGVLRDYLHALNVEAAEKGWPMIRHLWLHYPDDLEVLELEYEYLLGRDILVIPSLAPYRNKRHNGDHVQAYFPAGTWQHLLVPGVTVTGPQKLEVASPLGQPAVYIRADSPWRDRLVQGMAAVYRRPGK